MFFLSLTSLRPAHRRELTAWLSQHEVLTTQASPVVGLDPAHRELHLDWFVALPGQEDADFPELATAPDGSALTRRAVLTWVCEPPAWALDSAQVAA